MARKIKSMVAGNGTSRVVSRPKGALTNAAWNTFATLANVAIGLITAPVLIRNLGVSHYGIFLLIGSITGILSILNVGMGEATLRYVAHYSGRDDLEGVNRVFGSTLSLYVVVSSAVAIILLAVSPVVVAWLNIPASEHVMVTELVRLAGIIFVVRVMTSTVAVVPLALQRFDIGSKVSTVIAISRSGGYVGLVLCGFGLTQLIVLDLILGLVTLAIWVIVARRLLPGLNLMPSFSFEGLKETAGYGVFSFLTWAFHTMHRESGKLLLSRFAGTASVAYLGTPDNMAQRIHMVIASGSEALVPRFGTERDPEAGQRLFWSSTWWALTLAFVLFIPFFILIPDFLRLWISPEFSRHSASVGKLLAAYLISQSAFAPVATYFRGIGKPWFVTIVIFGSLIITTGMGLVLIPSLGVEGAAIAYLAGSSAPFVGVIVGGLYAFGRSSVPRLVRTVGVPMAASVVAILAGILLRNLAGDLTWFSLAGFGALLLSESALIVIGADWVLGGEFSPSRRLADRVINSRRLVGLRKLITVKPAV